MLNAKNFGLACGITWAIGVLFLGFFSQYMGYGTEILGLIGTVYKGYDSTMMGIVIGAFWGFLDGLIGGYIFAWIYNKLP